MRIYIIFLIIILILSGCISNTNYITNKKQHGILHNSYNAKNTYADNQTKDYINNIIANQPDSNSQLLADNSNKMVMSSESQVIDIIDMSPFENQTWSDIYIKADILEVHSNLNQKATIYDLVINDWALPFHLDAPIQLDDKLYFCSSIDSFNIEMININTQQIIFNSIISGVQQC